MPGHQVTEIGLAKLFLVTGERKYLELAKFFIDERGRSTPRGEVYNQDHLPIEEQTEAVGTPFAPRTSTPASRMWRRSWVTPP